jgi:Uma2 family endonuclease
MKTDDLFSPDISFATNQQWKKHKKSGETFFQGSPIFVIEVLSPGDKIGALDEKIPQYFENGAKLAWVVNPISKTVLVYHGPSADKLYKLGDSLDGENVLPGFALPLTEVFED